MKYLFCTQCISICGFYRCFRMLIDYKQNLKHVLQSKHCKYTHAQSKLINAIAIKTNQSISFISFHFSHFCVRLFYIAAACANMPQNSIISSAHFFRYFLYVYMYIYILALIVRFVCWCVLFLCSCAFKRIKRKMCVFFYFVRLFVNGM